MANKVLLKKSSTAAKVPATSDLDYGELAINYADGKLYFKNSSNVIQSFGSTSAVRVTSNTTAVAGKVYIADTSGGTFTITLPSSPTTGDTVTILDGYQFSTTAVTVGRNGSTIESSADDLSLNITGVSVTLTYDGTTWQVYTQVGANGGTEVTLGGSQTLTNKTISGSSNTLSNIGNSSLTNSSISINGNSVSLGGSVSSLVTLTGTETLTNKTLTTPTIATINAPAASGLTLTSPSGYDVVITAGGNSSYFKQSGTIEPYGAISGSSYGSNYVDVTQLGPVVLGGELYGAKVRTSADRTTFYEYEFGTTGVLSVPSISVPTGASVTANSATNKYINVGTHGQLFDDGNFHIHSSDGALWLNSLNGSDINLGLQSNSGTSVAKANSLHMNAGYGSIAPTFGVRAWISCGYVGGTMVTNGSGNLSVSRISAGKYQFTFGTAMPDGNYSVTCTAKTPVDDSDVAVNIGYNTTTQTTGFIIHCARYGTGFLDVPQLCVQVVR